MTLEFDDIQATILRYRPEPYIGTHFFAHINDPKKARLALAQLIPHIASAKNWWEATDAWIAIAFSYTGLVALGLPQDSLNSFPLAFKEGMAQRAEYLCDDGLNAPEHWEDGFKQGQIHFTLSVFSDSNLKWKKAVKTVEEKFHSDSGTTMLTKHHFKANIGCRNPFGYKDLISQPAIEGSGVDPLPGQGKPLKAGEFVLGYPAEKGVPYPYPQPDILGKNGTFVGLRKYQCRVGAFNRFLKTNAPTDEERELLAAKLVGRWRSGAPLILAPTKDDPILGEDCNRNNDFTFKEDPHGKQVPLGAHMRRLNPRDTQTAVMTDVNIHRIIRRSTTFGADYSPDAISTKEDEIQRGIYFIFMNARVTETMEFLQQEWINNGNFMALGKECDPIIGTQEDGKGLFTVPLEHGRKRYCGLENFNILKGGEYLFLPGLSALKWISQQG